MTRSLTENYRKRWFGTKQGWCGYQQLCADLARFKEFIENLKEVKRELEHVKHTVDNARSIMRGKYRVWYLENQIDTAIDNPDPSVVYNPVDSERLVEMTKQVASSADSSQYDIAIPSTVAPSQASTAPASSHGRNDEVPKQREEVSVMTETGRTPSAATRMRPEIQNQRPLSRLACVTGLTDANKISNTFKDETKFAQRDSISILFPLSDSMPGASLGIKVPSTVEDDWNGFLAAKAAMQASMVKRK